MKGYVTTEWGQVHYWQEGQTGPTLVLFHESPLSGRVFERALPLLARTVQAYAFDTPGFGNSDPPEGPLEVTEYARRLLRAIDTLGVGRFALAGVHTGAAIALEVTLQAGESRVSHLVLSGIPLLTDEERRTLQSLITAPELHPDGSHLPQVWNSRVRSWGKDAPVELLHMGAIEMLRVYLRYHWAYPSVFSYDPGPGLSRLSCPVLLINAELDRLAQADVSAVKLVRSGS
ncbi:MAG: alpha/beta fold hydrolase, partial [Armatimonadota bacterium]